MAYIPPHKRTGDGVSSPTAAMLVPRFRKNNLHVSDTVRSPTAAMVIPGFQKRNKDKIKKIVFAENAVWKWFAVGLDGKEMESLPSLQQVTTETFHSNNGVKPFVLTRGSSITGKAEDCLQTPDGSEKPWNYIADKILKNLIRASKFARDRLEVEGSNQNEMKPVLRARVGTVLFFPSFRSDENPVQDLVGEPSLKQLNQVFSAKLPSLYADRIVDEVVAKIGAGFKEQKDLYQVHLFDKCRPDTIIICKCRVMKEENKLELYKIECNLERQLVYDVSCVEKSHDLRLMLCTKQIVASPFDDDDGSISTLISSAILDPEYKGGLRWPFGKASSSEGRYRVTGTWHTVSRVYANDSLRIVVRNADRFNFTSTFGETSTEIEVVLKGLLELLGDKEVDAGSVSKRLKDALQMLYENFLLPEGTFM